MDQEQKNPEEKIPEEENHPEEKKPEEKKKKRNPLNFIIPVAAIAVIAVSAYHILSYYVVRKQSDLAYEEIIEENVTIPEDGGMVTAEVQSTEGVNASEAESSAAEAETVTEEEVVTYPDLDIDYAGLKEINEDFVCFLYIPVLDCAYPVAKSHDNTEYLTTTFYGETNPNGSIFLDQYSSEDLNDRNSFIEGHNMRTGAMFGCLKRFYQDADLCDQDPYFYLYTEDAVRKYRIFGYARVAEDDSLYDADVDYSSDEVYDGFIDRIRSISLYDVDSAGIDFSTYPNLVTLSTCYGVHDSGVHFVVFGALVGIAESS